MSNEKKASDHKCHHPYCNVSVPPKMLACRQHWFQLPRKIRRAIWAAYRPGQEKDKDPSTEWMEAFRLAVEFWKEKHQAEQSDDLFAT